MKKLLEIVVLGLFLSACSSKDHNLKFEVIQLYCLDKGDLSKEIIFNYKILNNYEKDIKYIDAHFVVNDLFGKELIKYKILSKAFVESNSSKLFKARKNVTFGNECSKLTNVNFDDLQIDFIVKQIAFDDNSVVKLNSFF